MQQFHGYALVHAREYQQAAAVDQGRVREGLVETGVDQGVQVDQFLVGHRPGVYRKGGDRPIPADEIRQRKIEILHKAVGPQIILDGFGIVRQQIGVRVVVAHFVHSFQQLHHAGGGFDFVPFSQPVE